MKGGGQLFKANTELANWLHNGGVACRGPAALQAAWRLVLARCSKFGFTLNAAKCRVGHASVVFAGVQIAGRTMRPLDSYIETILAFGRPETRADMVSFLGMCGWVLPHLHTVFEELAILRQTLRSARASAKAHLPWSPAAEAAFFEVRRALADPAVLYAFDETKPLVVLTDASNLGASCLFMQLHVDEVTGKPVLRLVNALCHTFSAAERNYTTAEQELAALRAGRQRLPHLFIGRCIIWLTDNTSVAELLQSARVSKRKRLRTTWADLTGCRVVAVHLAGKFNTLADALSRNPAWRTAPTVDEDATLEISFESLAAGAVPIAAFRPGPLSEADLRAAAVDNAMARVQRIAPELAAQAAELQLCDDSLAPALEAAATGASWHGMSFEMLATNDLRLLFAQAPASPVDRWTTAHRRLVMVVPRGLRQPVLEVMHAATAHGGHKRLRTALEAAFWWPRMADDAKAFLEACDACKRAVRAAPNGTVGNSERDELLRPERPGDVYEVDSWQWPMPNNVTLTFTSAICKYTGFVTLQRAKDQSSVAAAALVRRLHDSFGPFRAVHHDGGPEFHAAFEQLCKRLGSVQTRGTPRNSNSQARIERVFRSLNDLIVRVLTHNPGAHVEPDDIVSAAAIALNTTWSPAAPGAPPSTAFSRMYGRPAPFSLLLAATATPASDALTPIDANVAQFVIALANEAVVPAGPPQPMPHAERAALRAAQERASARAATAAYGPPPPIQIGDLVFLINPETPMGKISKIVRSRLGPFRVVALAPAPPAQPIKARIALLGDHALETEVFVRDIQQCGPALHIDDPVLRTLPPSGYFVAELAHGEAPAAMARLQAIVDQALAPPQRALLQTHRQSAWRRAIAEEENRVKIAEEVDEASDNVVPDDDIGEAVAPPGVEENDDDNDDESDVEPEPPEADLQGRQLRNRRAIVPPRRYVVEE